MEMIFIFLLGLLLGALCVYFFKRNKGMSGIAVHAAKQQSEKESRKEKILQMVRDKGAVTNNDVESILGVSDASATNYLQELEREGRIEQIGERGRFVTYRLKS